jgi:5-guanidino-2-oxopentanoate decarboxylase
LPLRTAYAAAPKSLEELPEVLAQAFKADRPTLIYLTPQTAV